jgi:antitoxin component of RelBE/YafQ-DinJ toxin-antitoxin module
MARKKLTPDEEASIRRASEQAHREGADLTYVGGVSRGKEPTAVLSVRVPLALLQSLREIAARDGLSLSEVVQNAVTTCARAGGSPFSTSSDRFVIATSTKSLSYGILVRPILLQRPELSQFTGGSVPP